MGVRKAVFMGSWYPAGARECEQEIASYLEPIQTADEDRSVFTAGVVPHAGWYYSGAIACNVIQRLTSGPAPDVVAIFGMHLHPESTPRLMSHGSWETPFGELAVHTRLAQALEERFRFEIETPTRFSRDNTIELQLPFVRYFFGNVDILPMGLPPAALSLDIARWLVTQASQMGLTLKVIGSTDLTHYGPNYGFTPHGAGAEALQWVRGENDRRMVDALLAMDASLVIAEGLSRHNACCAGAAAGTIVAAKHLGADKAQAIAYATSHDKSPGESFVGYTGIVFE